MFGKIIAKKISLAVILLVFFLIGGCSGPRITMGDVRAQNASRLLILKIGMDRYEVLKIMGTEAILVNHRSGPYNGEKIPNPYRTETRKEKNKLHEVLFYYTDNKKADGAITDDELTPLVFDDEKLIGWGWSFFEDTAQKYELKVKER